MEEAAGSIRSMQGRGTPLVGATAACRVCLAVLGDASDWETEAAFAAPLYTRPTTLTLMQALGEMASTLRNCPCDERLAAASAHAVEICWEDLAKNRGIGEQGAGEKMVEADIGIGVS